MLFYTHSTRDATSILEKQNEATLKKDEQVVRNLLEIKDIGIEIRKAILSGNLRRFGELLDVHWQCKKGLQRVLPTVRSTSGTRLQKAMAP